MTAPAVVLLTVNVATPLPLVVAEAGEIVEPTGAPPSETVLPGTTWSWASRSVSVTVEVEVPSAVTVVGEATSSDAPPVAAPGVKATDALCETTTDAVVSVAV